jgi:hypothetical protein
MELRARGGVIKPPARVQAAGGNSNWEAVMNGIIYLVGLVVVILAVLSFFGLR